MQMVNTFTNIAKESKVGRVQNTKTLTSMAEGVIYTYGNILFRTCRVILGNEKEAEKAVQGALLQYLQKAPVFQDRQQEKTWLITAAIKQCKDRLRFQIWQKKVDLNRTPGPSSGTEEGGILAALMSLPETYKTVMLLHYVEEYTVDEIAEIIGRTASVVKTQLQKGCKLLEEVERKESQ